MLRRTALTLAGLAPVLAISACGGASEPLAEFHDQQVDFESCAPYAMNAADEQTFADDRFDCARVEVPLDYADPDGERGSVALLRAEARGDKIGSLLINPGGPGVSGMSFAAALGPVWDNTVIGERFDIIGWDTRGVGASTPLVQCHTDEQLDRNESPWPYLFSFTSEQQADDLAQRCVDGTGGVAELTSVGSANVVQEMDVLREVLGDDQLSYLGYSYGSELGAMYAETFPDNVRAIVLDGAVHPELTEPEFRQTQFTAFQEVFDGMAALCAQDADCPLGTDPAGASAAFQELIDPLREEPLAVSRGRELTYEDVLRVVPTSLFNSSHWPAVIEGLADLAEGDGTALLQQRDSTLGRGPDGRYGGALNVDANLAIRCMDNPRSPQEQDALLEHAREAAPFTAPGFPEGSSVYECAGWPEPVSRDLPWVTGDVDLPPTLTVSLTGDPGTPHDGGISMARVLGGSLVSVEGIQHGVSLYFGNTCVDDAVTDYLVDLQTPADDLTCTL